MKPEKPLVMRLADDNQEQPKSITVSHAELKNVSEFRYLGSDLNNSLLLDKEVTYRTGRAAAAFVSLRLGGFSNKNYKLTTKLSVYTLQKCGVK